METIWHQGSLVEFLGAVAGCRDREIVPVLFDSLRFDRRSSSISRLQFSMYVLCCQPWNFPRLHALALISRFDLK